jgi:tetratricopeptide (TPR) repeat protein
MLLPFDLSVFPILADMKISTMLGIPALAGLVGMALFTKGKNLNIYIFSAVWFLSFILPSFIAITHQIPNFSEHRGYLPMVGLVIFLLSTDPVRTSGFTSWKSLTIITSIALIFSVLTIIHTRHFKDNIVFWTNAIETSPSHAFNYNNLGAMYFLKGDYATAEPFFRKALELNPYEPMANSNTGLICMNTGRPAEAEKFYLEEIRINPTYEHAYYNLGLLYYKHSRYLESLPLWEKILTINPYYTDAYTALLQVYSDTRRQDDFNRVSLMAKKYGIHF